MFKKTLSLATYQKILEVLLLKSVDHQDEFVKQSQSNEETILEFYHKYKRNFLIMNNENVKKYILKEKNGQLEKYEDGVPKILFSKYDRKTKLKTFLELVPYEKVHDILKSLHFVEINGIESCHPSSQNKLTKKFNDTYYFRGITDIAKTFLKKCKTCKVSNPLPMTIPAPPIPIRTFWPHQRIQADLIYIASKKRQYLANNKWKFKYILTVKCTFSKFVWLYPLQNRDAESVFKALCFLFEKEGFPEIFQSDNGKEFVAKIIKNFF